MASIVDLVEKVDSLALDTAKGVIRLNCIGMERGALCIELVGPKSVVNSEAAADIIEAVPGFPSKHLAFLRADDSVSMAWYKVK